MTHANARLEALCDGVFAIAMTLLILDVRLPATETIGTTADLWRALGHTLPSVFGFVLSFGVILITWVNHHTTFRLIDKTSIGFIYANGLLLLAVVAIPFPTSLMGAFLGTDHASPAIVVYNAVIAAVSISWILFTTAAIRGHLTLDDSASRLLAAIRRNAVVGVTLYGVLAIVAFWLPRTAAVVTALTWVFWLILGIRLKRT